MSDSAAKKILVIDDEEAMRGYLRLLLEKEGYAVREAADGHAGLAACRADPPDLVITDLVMPRMGGLETIRELRRAFPRVCIIAISGFGNDIEMQAARSLGADRVWPKTDLRLRLAEELPRLLG
jgi:CheY-like chemotaxis protein